MGLRLRVDIKSGPIHCLSTSGFECGVDFESVVELTSDSTSDPPTPPPCPLYSHCKYERNKAAAQLLLAAVHFLIDFWLAKIRTGDRQATSITRYFRHSEGPLDPTSRVFSL
jgi:hypothetical protein